MPKRILIIGLLFCLFGVLAIWEVLTNLAQSKINLNFAVFCLPIGIGLLRGKASSRWWARFWIILGYVFCGILAGMGLVSPGVVRVNLSNQVIEGIGAVPYLIGGSALAALMLFGLHKLLYSKRASEFFERRSLQHDAAR